MLNPELRSQTKRLAATGGRLAGLAVCACKSLLGARDNEAQADDCQEWLRTAAIASVSGNSGACQPYASFDGWLINSGQIAPGRETLQIAPAAAAAAAAIAISLRTHLLLRLLNFLQLQVTSQGTPNGHEP
ncbi:unnamed protein product [Soboliphyme baturini]|uniref:Uncharacterized protein n=1 Tax=Soboliphyme baturini TaxID=241478 RepID=A0A183J6L3_9BILA|nr:unnamed protein product [Soboliphyme baturini]